MLFLQAAGSDFDEAHDLVAAITEVLQAPHDGQPRADFYTGARHNPSRMGFAHRRWATDPERIAERVERTGCKSHESLLVALAAHTTIASPLTDLDLDWIASAGTRVGDEDLLLETAGVVFAFNTINRIADARRIKLEYRVLRQWKPIRGWVERRLASLIGMAYDLSYKHQPRHSPSSLLDRLSVVFERLGAPAVPDVFNWLSRSPVVLEGVVEMLEASIATAAVRRDLFKEAAAIAVVSRAMPGSSLTKAVDHWLSQESLPDSNTLLSWAAPSGGGSPSDLESACRRYAWQVANAAYTIRDEQISELSTLGLLDAELLDLTLATALFSALAIIEPISAAIAPDPAGRRRALQCPPEPLAAASSASYFEAP